MFDFFDVFGAVALWLSWNKFVSALTTVSHCPLTVHLWRLVGVLDIFCLQDVYSMDSLIIFFLPSLFYLFWTDDLPVSIQ